MAFRVPTKWKSLLKTSPDANEPSCGHAVCTLQVHPPTPPVPPFLLTQSVGPKDIAGSDIMKLKVSRRIYPLWALKSFNLTTSNLMAMAYHSWHSLLAQ